MKLLTIFTPTYNRAHTLPKLYESLKRQTSDNFLWLIVDDGSTDDTEQIVNQWMQESSFQITYIIQENGGKMRAHNRGVIECQTELFVCIDSDDYITDTAVEHIISRWNNSPHNKNCAGIIAYKTFVQKDGSTKLRCRFPYSHNSKLYELYRNGFVGDTTLVYRSDVLKRFLFPEIPGEKFIPESYVYNQIDKQYEMLLLDEALTVCEYMEDGYTTNSRALYNKNPKGMAMDYNMRSSLPNISFKMKIQATATYIVYATKAHATDIYKKSYQKGIVYLCAYLLSKKYRNIL